MRRKNQFIYTAIAVSCLVIAGFVVSCTPTGNEQRDCVVMLGDSIFDYSDEITAVLEELSGHEYRTYYLNGAQMDGGFITDIEAQYDQAIRNGAIRTIIMDGGGNDYLMGNSSEEEIAEEVRNAYMRIFDKAKDDGVENIVILGYYMTGTSPEGFEEQTIETGENFAAAGASRGINVVYVNPVADDWFKSRTPSQYTISDGIHPTDPASERLAQLIWDSMTANDIEQGENCSAFDGSGSGGCN